MLPCQQAQLWNDRLGAQEFMAHKCTKMTDKHFENLVFLKSNKWLMDSKWTLYLVESDCEHSFCLLVFVELQTVLTVLYKFDCYFFI